MLELETSSPYSIAIKKIEVVSERLPQSFDLYPVTAEITINENIDLPYLTGEIALMDSRNIFEMIDFRGTEKIKVGVQIPGDPTSDIVTKNFVVDRITTASHTNDTSEGMILHIVEEHAYLSRLMTISKSYTGYLDRIIADVAQDQLKKSVRPFGQFRETLQSRIRVLVPNLTPLDAIRWLKDRATGPHGLPVYVWSSFNDEDLVITDMEEILKRDVLNPDNPYRFSQMYTQKVRETLDVRREAYVIENYNRIMTEDMGRMLKNGAVSSHFDFINTLTDTDQIGKEKTKYTDKSVLTELESLGLFKKDQKKPIYDADFMLGGKSLEEHVPSVMSQIITSNTFEDGYQNIHEELTRPLHLQKTKSHLLRHYLLKSPLNVVVPGFNFLRRNGERDITIGRQIRLEFLKNDQDLYDRGAFASGSEIIDKKKSGTYVIYALKHVMTMNNYVVHITAGKLSSLN